MMSRLLPLVALALSIFARASFAAEQTTLAEPVAAAAAAAVDEGPARPRKLATADVLELYEDKHLLKPDAVLEQQEIHPHSSFMMGEHLVSLLDADLIPVDVFTADAKVFVDGVEEAPKPAVYKSKSNEHILIARNHEGKLLSAVHQDPMVKGHTNVVRVNRSGQYAHLEHQYLTVTHDHISDEALAQFRLAEEGGDERTRSLRGVGEDEVMISSTAPFVQEQELQKQVDTTHRELIGDCQSYGYDVIDMAIVVESMFCGAEGGNSGNVQSIAQSVVAGAATYFQAYGLCKTLRISQVQVYCNSNNDPIRSVINRSGSVNALLENFRNYISNAGIQADLNELFHAKQFSTSLIGLAYIGTLCRGSGYNTGVNYLAFSTLLSYQQKLIGHESAHIIGAQHVTQSTDLMAPTICRDCNASFGSSAKNSINSKVDSTDCTSHSGSSQQSKSNPAPAPVPQTQTSNNSGSCQDRQNFEVWSGNGCNWVARKSAQEIALWCSYLPRVMNNCPKTCRKC